MEKDTIVLIDTSSWIEALRATGKMEVRERVLNLMVEGRAAWCDMVAIELWNGARGAYERQKLSELDKEITCLQITREIWQKACALSHHAELEHQDDHMDFILTLSRQGRE